MTEPRIASTQLDNGLTVIVETMPTVRSAAFSLLTPAGVIYEPESSNGVATLAAEWLFRGTEQKTSRELSAAFDQLGVQRDEAVGPSQLTINGACLASRLADVLPLYGEVLASPRLPEDEFPAIVAGLEQSLLAIEDDPRERVMIELKRHFYPSPWGRPTDGTLADLAELTPAAVRSHCSRHVRPDQAILGIAGPLELAEILPIVRKSFANWLPGTAQPITVVPGDRRSAHLDYDSQQTQIGVAFPAVPYGHTDYYAGWAAVAVLSGGMSSRLFTEVREKRGLCYSVEASLHSLKDHASVLCYAGTKAERAQETLDVLLEELNRLEHGVQLDELARCQALAKSSLIMATESTRSRAQMLAKDWYSLGRVTTAQEVRAKVDALTPTDVVRYIRDYPPQPCTVVTLGRKPLEVRNAVA